MRYVLLLLLVGLLNACAPHTVRAPVGDRSVSGPLRNPASHTVRHGETLYSVAFLYGYEVSQVAAWNGLKPPYTIYKGQRLRLRPPPAPAPRSKPVPRSLPKPAPRPASAPKPDPRPVSANVSPSVPKTRPVTPSRPKTTARPATPAVKPVARAAHAVTPAKPAQVMLPSNRLRWAWPAAGPVLRTFNASSEGRKGINIGGGGGQPVRAAADGKIVYSGSGLGGYGRLIIIKHNKEFLSAYAHNRKLIAKEGQWVKKGQDIALMGNSGTDRVQLHFEIRKHGKPVDPLKYLPPR
jgi:lipoprotein NlpD